MPKGVYGRKPQSREHVEKRVLANTGKKRSAETRAKMIESQRKNSSKTSELLRRAYAEGRRIAVRFLGEKHWNWKGGLCNNPEYVSWSKNQRWREKRNNGGSHSFFEWQTVKAQYNFTCPCCGMSEPKIVLTQDHIIPVSKGGSDNIENIQPLCRGCNAKKFTKIIKY